VNKEQVKAFLIDLGELTAKHGIKIDGCGCCDSPYLKEANLVNSDVYAVDSHFGCLKLISAEEADERYLSIVGKQEPNPNPVLKRFITGSGWVAEE